MLRRRDLIWCSSFSITWRERIFIHHRRAEIAKLFSFFCVNLLIDLVLYKWNGFCSALLYVNGLCRLYMANCQKHRTNDRLYTAPRELLLGLRRREGDDQDADQWFACAQLLARFIMTKFFFYRLILFIEFKGFNSILIQMEFVPAEKEFLFMFEYLLKCSIL